MHCMVCGLHFNETVKQIIIMAMAKIIITMSYLHVVNILHMLILHKGHTIFIPIVLNEQTTERNLIFHTQLVNDRVKI